MGKLPGAGRTFRQRMILMPDVQLLASKKIRSRLDDRPRRWHWLDLWACGPRSRRVYLVTESNGKYFSQIEDFFTLGEARSCWRCEFRAPRWPAAVHALLRPEQDRAEGLFKLGL